VNEPSLTTTAEADGPLGANRRNGRQPCALFAHSRRPFRRNCSDRCRLVTNRLDRQYLDWAYASTISGKQEEYEALKTTLEMINRMQAMALSESTRLGSSWGNILSGAFGDR